ncbi:MarR family winged helix-turn-helix transcriptional regulator [Streptomyces sp. NPDC094472]|uniref:MarR family winged helix-turn-helix transcriptional regulator n=1 Tax=Streptomyces sp. NPDC094472 TaxID=3155080 RepID=UPI003319016F
MNDRDEELRGLDAVLREPRHSRSGLYGPLVRERFLGGLPADVTPTGYRVVCFVEASSPPGPAGSDIAALLLSDRARAVRVVDRLTAAGLVTRVRDTVDRRLRRVELTDAGAPPCRAGGRPADTAAGRGHRGLAGRGSRPADGVPGAAQRLRGAASAGVRRVRRI